MPLYEVRTRDFGNILVDADDIKAARKLAKERFKVRNPAQVRRAGSYVRCEVCDSAPCCCEGT